jgi:hypothetical protein
MPDKKPHSPRVQRPHKSQIVKPSKATFDDGDEPWRCRAKSKSKSKDKTTPVRCGQHKEPNFEVCRYHGARGGRPATHGRYSKSLHNFRERYQEALDSGDQLLDLRETMALIDLQVQRAAERLGEFDTPQFRKEALTLFRRARASTDEAEVRSLLADLGRLLEAGAREDQALEALTTAAERLAFRQEKAWAVKLSAAQAINARDMIAVLVRMVDIITEEAPTHAARIVGRIDSEIVGGSEIAPRTSS